jgi:hypothetical protein
METLSGRNYPHDEAGKRVMEFGQNKPQPQSGCLVGTLKNSLKTKSIN